MERWQITQSEAAVRTLAIVGSEGKMGEANQIGRFEPINGIVRLTIYINNTGFCVENRIG